MKRILCVCLAMLMLIAPSSIAEENIDFSSYNLDELLDMSNQIQTEITKRNPTEYSTIPSGTYQAGVDIAQGRYRLFVPKDVNYFVRVRVFPDIAAYSQYANDSSNIDSETTTMINLYYGLTSCYISIEPDSVLSIYGDGCMIEEVSYSWQP